MHPLLINKISDLVSSNICDVYEVRKMVKHYTDNELAKKLGFKPNEHDRAFYPDIMDIKNHVYRAKRALELSKLDQENLRLKVNEWAANDTENNFYLRPYVEASDASKKDTSDVQVETGTSAPQRFYGNSGEDDNWCEVLGSSKQCSQSFLYVHQASWQKRLLECYGNTMCLLDATYKTT